MNRIDAVAVVRSYLGEFEKVVAMQSIEELFRLAQERNQMLMDAGNLLASEIERILGEQTDGPITKLLESFWLYFRATEVLNTVNGILGHAAASQPVQQPVDAGFAALDAVAEQTLGKK